MGAEDPRDRGPQPAVLHRRGLFDGDVYLATFDEEQFTDTELLSFTGKVRVNHDPALDRATRRAFRTGSRSRSPTGSSLFGEVEFPRGHAGNPMTDAEVEGEVSDVGRTAIWEGEGRSDLARCWDLEKLTNVTELIQIRTVRADPAPHYADFSRVIVT